MTTLPASPSLNANPTVMLEDVTYALGEWAGTIIGQIDHILAGLNDGDWKGNSRAILLEHVGHVIIDFFDADEHTNLIRSDIDELDRIASRHLAEFVVVKSLAERRRGQEPIF